MRSSLANDDDIGDLSGANSGNRNKRVSARTLPMTISRESPRPGIAPRISPQTRIKREPTGGSSDDGLSATAQPQTTGRKGLLRGMLINKNSLDGRHINQKSSWDYSSTGAGISSHKDGGGDTTTPGLAFTVACASSSNVNKTVSPKATRVLLSSSTTASAGIPGNVGCTGITASESIRTQSDSSPLQNFAFRELGSPVKITAWVDILLNQTAMTAGGASSGVFNLPTPQRGTPLQKFGSVSSIISSTRRASTVDRRSGSRPPTSEVGPTRDVGRIVLKRKTNAATEPVPNLSITDRQGMPPMTSQLSLETSLFGIDLRCVKPFCPSVPTLSNDSESNQCNPSTPCWLGWILKKKRHMKLFTVHDIGIGLPSNLEDLALTSSQWGYAVAAYNGDIHVCAVNIGRLFWLTRFQLEESARRLRHEAKVQGLWPMCRASAEFEDEAHVRWLCHPLSPSSNGEAPMRDAASAAGAFNGVSPKHTPKVGQLRKDLTFHTTPFWTFVGDTTGYKKVYIPTDRFARGLKRHVAAKYDHGGNGSLNESSTMSSPANENQIGKKKSSHSMPNGKMVQVYGALGVTGTMQAWQKRMVCRGKASTSGGTPNALARQDSIDALSDDAPTIVQTMNMIGTPSDSDLPNLYIERSPLEATVFSSPGKIQEGIAQVLAYCDVSFVPIDRIFARVPLDAKGSSVVS